MKWIGAILIAAVAGACADSPSAPANEDVEGPAFAATTAMYNVSEPFQLDVFIECAAGGAGEVVHLEGMLHSTVRWVIDNQGGVHARFHDQPQMLSGRGLTTGLLYQGTGVTMDGGNDQASGLPMEFTFVNNYRIIGQGPGNDFIEHLTNHYTINANGEVTADVFHLKSECR